MDFSFLTTRRGIVVLGLLIFAALSVVTYLALPKKSRREHFWLSLLVICLGACIGALLGALVSPFYTAEDQAFKLVAGIASAFLAGFIWKSFEADIRSVVGSVVKLGAADNPGPACLFAFLVAIFLSAFVNYAFREYATDRSTSYPKLQMEALQEAVDELQKQLSKNP